MSFCEQCGGSLSEGARFCASCGKPTGVAVSPASSGVASSATGERLPKLIFGALCLLVLLVAVDTAAISYILRRANQKVDELTQGLPLKQELLPVNSSTTALQNPDSQHALTSA